MKVGKKLYDKICEDVLRFQTDLGLNIGADRSMILLKGHLLIEDILQTMIDHLVPCPDDLTEARLTFFQRLCLAKTLRDPSKVPESDWIWDAVNKLNKLRNLMVHNLTPKQFEEKIDEFMTQIEEHITVPVEPGTGDVYRMARFGASLSFLSLYLSHLVRAHTEAE